MNKTNSKQINQRKGIAFLLIITLLVGGLITPISSMAGNADDSTLKVTFKVSDKKSEDIEIDVPTNEDGTVTLTKDIIPDDPNASDDQKFVGWQNKSAEIEKEQEKVYTKDDLKDMTLTEETDFKALYEEKAESDSKVESLGGDDSNDTNKDSNNNEDSDKGNGKDAAVEEKDEPAKDSGAKKSGGVSLQADDEPVKIINVTSTNANKYGTYANNTSRLDLSAKYNVNTTSSINGTKITIELENTDNNYFILPTDPDNLNELIGTFNLPTSNIKDGSLNVEAKESGKKIQIQFELEKGSSGSDTTFSVNFDFDHSNFDRKVPTDKTLASIKVSADLGGAVSTKTLNVISYARPGHSIHKAVKTPDGDIAAGSEANFNLSWDNSPYGYWLDEPGTNYILKVEYPDGAEVIGETKGLGTYAPAGVVNAATNSMTWDAGIVDASGMPKNWYGNAGSTYNIPSLKIKFPNNKFSDGDHCVVTVSSIFTKWGETTRRTVSKTLEFNIKDMGIHMSTNDISATGSYKPAVAIDDTGYTRSVGSSHGTTVYKSASNAGSSPIPETCLTWSNDTTYKKSNPSMLYVNNGNVLFKNEVVIYTNNGTGTNPKTITTTLAAAKTVNGYVPLDLTKYISDGEYVEKFEIYPIDDSTGTEQRALPIGAECFFGIFYDSWKTGSFPDGTKINHNDYSDTTATLSWKGESTPAAFSSNFNTTGNVGDETYTRTFNNNKESMRVYYGDNSPAPTAWFKFDTTYPGGTFAPGATFSSKLMLLNCAQYNATHTWENPEIAYLPTDSIELAPGKYSVYDNDNKLVVGAVCEVSTEKINEHGEREYRIIFNGLDPIERRASSGDNTCNYYSPIKFNVLYKSNAGVQSLSKAGETDAYPLTHGKIFATSQGTPNNIIYNELYTDLKYYDDSVTKYGKGKESDYLLPGKVTCNMTISRLVNLQPSAHLLNNEIGDYQSVDDVGAKSTVPLNGSGKVKLEMSNEGNTYMKNIALLDILPHVGDTKVTDPNTTRGSLWDATLTGVDVKVFDISKKENDPNYDVTSQYSVGGDWYTIEYSKAGSPTYKANGISRNGTDGAFALGKNYTQNMSEAKSFVFFTNGDVALEPGHKIVITIEIKAPSTVDLNSVGQVAYNSFAATAKSYNTATATSGDQTSVNEPTKQNFVIADADTAYISQSGVIFKDVDRDNKYNTSKGDVPYSDVTVKLWNANNAGNILIDVEPKVTKTSIDGKFLFENLPSGHYVIQVIKPDGTGYLYSAQGNDGTNDDSHVDKSGYSNLITLGAGEQKLLNFSAGIQATATLDVEFRLNTTNGALVAPAIKTTYGALGKVTVTPSLTDAKYTIPAGYSIKSGDPKSQSYTFDWDSLNKKMIFVLTEDEYTVRYFTNDGTNTEFTSQTGIKYDKKVTEPAVNPLRKGYNFAGWFTTKVAIDPANTYEFDFANTGIKGDTNLYAGWNSYTYKVTFDPNTGAIPNVAGTTDRAISSPHITLSEAGVSFPDNAVKTGYNFKGWSTTNTGIDGSTEFKLDTLITGNRTVYAIYEDYDYPVTFDANKGKIDNQNTKTINVTSPATTVGEKMPLDSSVVRDHYQFEGWATTTSALTADFTSSTAVTKPTTVYALWTPNTYKVSFDTQGGSTAPKDEVFTAPSLKVEAVNIPAVPTKEGFKFKGWFTSPNGVGTKYDVSYTVTKTQTVYADWEQLYYDVTYYENHGSNKVYATDTKITHGSMTTKPSTDPTRTGYIFDGWYTTKVTEADPINGTKWNFNDQVTTDTALYAGWKTYNYAVTFDGNGGKVSGSNQAVKNVISPNTTVGNNMPANSDVTRDHYTFKGWSSTQNGTTPDFTGNTTITGHKTVYAIWEANSYTVKFDTQGGSAAPGNAIFTAPNLTVTKLPAEPSMTGYTFKGWFTGKNGTGTQYKNGYEVTKDQTVYANWTINNYKLTFDANGGTGAPGAQTINFNAKAKAVSNPSRTGYTFSGWTMEKNGGKSWSQSSFTMPAKDVTVYAQWTAVPTTPTDNTDDPVTPAVQGQTARNATSATSSFTPDGGTVAGQKAEIETNVIDPKETPEVGIGDNKIPLFDNDSWALVNLLLAVAGVVLALIVSVMAVYRRFRNNDDDYYIDENDNYYKETKKNRALCIVGIILSAIAGVVLFILTQDITLSMALFDSWTIFNAIILVIEVVFAVFAFRTKRSEIDESNFTY